MPLLMTYLCYWSRKYFISICPLWYSFLTQHGNSLAVTLQRRQMGCPYQVCSVLEKGQGTKLDEPLQWPAGPSQLPFFPMGVVCMWLEAHLPWDRNRHFNNEAGGLQGSGDEPVGVGVSQPIEINTCFIINPWKSLVWHGEIEVSALHGSSRSCGACFSRDKHP